MNRADLIEIVSNQVGVSKVSVDRLVSSVLEAIQSAVSNGEAVTLEGFGTFEPVDMGAAIAPKFFAESECKGAVDAKTPVLQRGEACNYFEVPTDALVRGQQIAQALSAVSACHPRMAKAIGSFWGFPECRDYLARIAVDGWDPHIHESVGFNAEVLGAIRSLQLIHAVTPR